MHKRSHVKSLTLLSLALLTAGAGYAQRADAAAAGGYAWQQKSHSVTGQFGVGWFGLINGLDFEYTDEDTGERYDATWNGGPAATLAYDYRVGRSFSIGGALAYQGNRFTDFTRADGTDAGRGVEGQATLRRTFISARTLWHYGRARNFEFYSGLRVGATVWTVTATGDIDPNNVDVRDGSSGSIVLPHLTIIPFGFKGFLNDNVYLGAETMFGSPHIAAAQVGYRF